MTVCNGNGTTERVLNMQQLCPLTRKPRMRPAYHLHITLLTNPTTLFGVIMCLLKPSGNQLQLIKEGGYVSEEFHWFESSVTSLKLLKII